MNSPKGWFDLTAVSGGWFDKTARREGWFDGQLLETPSTGASAALSGTITTATEANIVAGGKTIILTLTGDTWVAAGVLFDAQRSAIIMGLDSAQAEALGWDNTVKVLQGVAGVVRTSNTVVTITLDARPTYSVTANETITATVPASALTGGVALVAAPTFTVTDSGGATVYIPIIGKGFGMTLAGSRGLAG